MDNFRFNLILSIEEHETVVRIRFPIHRTIGQLKQFIDNIIHMEGLQGDVYFLFHANERQLIPEYLLGGELMPEDVPLLESMIDNHSTFYAQCTPIERPLSAESAHADETIQENEQASDEAEDADVPDVPDVPENTISNHIVNYLTQSLNTLQTLNRFNTVEGLTTLDNILQQSTRNSMFDTIITGLNGRQPSQQPTIISGGGSITISADGQVVHNSEGAISNQNPFDMVLNMFIPLQTHIIQPQMEDVVVGLHKADLDVLRVNLHRNFDNKDSCDTCPICIEKFKEEDICRELKCHHLFHRDCVDHWLESNIKCPVCRNETGRGVPKI
jgi:hypothetical protein